MTALDRALVAPKNLNVDELAKMLASTDEGLWREIFAAAREVKAKCGKTEVCRAGLSSAPMSARRTTRRFIVGYDLYPGKVQA